MGRFACGCKLKMKGSEDTQVAKGGRGGLGENSMENSILRFILQFLGVISS